MPSRGDLYLERLERAEWEDDRLERIARKQAATAQPISVSAQKTRTEGCRRCGGTGILPQFMHVQGGTCFRCGGTGLVTVEVKTMPDAAIEWINRNLAGVALPTDVPVYTVPPARSARAECDCENYDGECQCPSCFEAEFERGWNMAEMEAEDRYLEAEPLGYDPDEIRNHLR